MKNSKIMFLGTLENNGNPLTDSDKDIIFDAIIDAVENAGYSFHQHVLLAEDVDDIEKVKWEIKSIF